MKLTVFLVVDKIKNKKRRFLIFKESVYIQQRILQFRHELKKNSIPNK